ncbi:MAG: nucleotidyltransferase domain-containing protein [Nanoarchaeota archaeon]
MENLNSELVSLASAFVSFIIPKIKVEEIILFGSVARDEADKNSDVDIFIDVKENEKEVEKIIKKELLKFYKSQIYDKWRIKEINNELSVKVGDINNWELKEIIKQEGIILYGKNKSNDNLIDYTYFNLKPIKNIAKRNKTIRFLYGRKEKNKETKGIIEKIGKKLNALSFIVLTNQSREIIDILRKEKVEFSFFNIKSNKELLNK